MTKHSNVIDKILKNCIKFAVNGQLGEQVFIAGTRPQEAVERAKQSLATELVRMLEEALGDELSTERLTSQKLIDARLSQNQLKRQTRTRLTAIIERELK